MPFHLAEVHAALEACTVFLCVGSSGVVEPAASLARQVRWRGDTRSYYVGPEEPANRDAFDECFWGKAGEVLPGLIGARNQ
jgi:NAD-dependent deacetylase